MASPQNKSDIVRRPPVVGILGHIDHGKSTLLDYIRKSNVVEKEAGGITQHISAYEVMHKNQEGREMKITFLDTPGHEAFANVRTRGASVADIAVLIVSAEDGPKPQTLEVYNYIKESSIPFFIAATKIDKPTADLPRTKQALAENGIYVEGYGGDVPFVPVSSTSGQGVDDLLDMITLMADLQELTGEPETLGSGVVIESKRDPKRGITAVAIIKNGTLRQGTFAACGGAWAPLRLILDAAGTHVEELTFSSPAQIIGWDMLPTVGSEFKTFLKKDEALAYAEEHKEEVSSKQYVEKTDEHAITLPLIIKADTAGSLEAIENEVAKLSRERITPKVIFSGVGAIGESDVKFALSTPGTLILGFHTKVDAAAAALAERSDISITLFTIIYELTEKVTTILAEREPRIEVEEVSGSAKVLRIFSTSKGKQVLGARVLSGTIALGTQIKIMRRESEIGRGRIRELQQAKVATSEVGEGAEFGALIESKLEIAPGDILEAVAMVTK